MHTKNYKNEKTAFTLAETLVVLAIVGTIAALTIPGLISGTQNKEYIAGAKKGYATISRATEMVQNTLGPISMWSSYTTKERIWDEYKKQLNVSKDCTDAPGCFYNGQYKRLNGTSVISDNVNIDGQYFKALLADGTSIGIAPLTTAEVSAYGLSSDVTIYGFAIMDINGEHGPNKYGKDVFRFAITQDGALPAGSSDSSDCARGSTGLNCAAKVIIEDKITY